MSTQESPDGDLLRYANLVLDDRDTNNLSSTLKSLQDQLVDVEASLATEREVEREVRNKYQKEMMIHSRILTALSSTQRKLQKSISLHEALLEPSAIRNLPSEVLTHIFLHHLQNHIPASLTQRVSPINILMAQNLPLRVCRRWRNAAISDPRLWRTICLFPPKSNANNMSKERYLQLHKEHWRLLEERIGFSYSFTIDLLTCHLVNPPRSQPEQDWFNEPQKEMLSFLFKLLPRTSKLYLSHASASSSSPSEPFVLCSTTQDIYRHLIEMRIFMGDNFRENDFQFHRNEEWYRSIVTCAPHLQNINAYPLSVSMLTTTPRPQLVHLHLYTSTVLDLAALLDLSPHLEDIHIHEITRNEGAITTVVRQERLSHLRIDTAGVDFLEALSLPGLTHLQCSMCNNDEAWPTPASVAFFHRSDCMLQSLLLYGSDISASLADILLSQTSLSVLNLQRVSHFQDTRASILPTPVLDFFGKNLHRFTSLTSLSFAIGARQVPRAQKMLAAVLESRKEGGSHKMHWYLRIAMSTDRSTPSGQKMLLNHGELLNPAVLDLRDLGVNVDVRHC